MRMRESPPLRRLVPCACKRTGAGLVFRDGQLLWLCAVSIAKCNNNVGYYFNHATVLRPAPVQQAHTAGPLCDPITLLQGLDYQCLFLSLLRHVLVQAASLQLSFTALCTPINSDTWISDDCAIVLKSSSKYLN